MKKILITGALGQIGSELTMNITRNLWIKIMSLQQIFGKTNSEVVK